MFKRFTKLVAEQSHRELDVQTTGSVGLHNPTTNCACIAVLHDRAI